MWSNSNGKLEHDLIHMNNMKDADQEKDMESNGFVNQKGSEQAQVVTKMCMDGHEITIECTIETKFTGDPRRNGCARRRLSWRGSTR